MTKEKLKEIFDDTESKWEGDNAFKGLLILSKYTNNLIVGAEHDIIYSASVDDIVDSLTEEDATELAKLNWSIDQYEHFTCFV